MFCGHHSNPENTQPPTDAAHTINSLCRPEAAQVIRKAKDLPTKDLCTRSAEIPQQTKSSGSDSSRPLLPADCFFDLPRLDAIFGSEIAYRFAGIEPGSDHRSRDAGARDHRFAKTYRRIDLDQLGFILRPPHDEWVQLEETSGIAFDTFQVKFHHPGDQYLLVFRQIHNIPEMFDEQVPAIGLESLLDERMLVLNILGKSDE